MYKGYYKQLEDNYSRRLSPRQYIVVRLDGVGVSKGIDLYNSSKTGFIPSMQKTCAIIAFRLKAKAYFFGSDEASFVFDSHTLLTHYKKLECQKIASLLAQAFYCEFNLHYKGNEPIFFDARVFNLHPFKVTTYLTHRQNIVKNCQAMHFAKKYIPAHLREKMPLAELLQLIEQTAPEFKAVPAVFKEGEMHCEVGLPIQSDLELLDFSSSEITWL